jgi:hypothetical protein
VAQCEPGFRLGAGALCEPAADPLTVVCGPGFEFVDEVVGGAPLGQVRSLENVDEF